MSHPNLFKFEIRYPRQIRSVTRARSYAESRNRVCFGRYNPGRREPRAYGSKPQVHLRRRRRQGGQHLVHPLRQLPGGQERQGAPHNPGVCVCCPCPCYCRRCGRCCSGGCRDRQEGGVRRR
eukprot:XP_001706515.1 Hypothetical protein GL50803_26925 [Giardia lamblia ATCC 50803]